MKLRILNLSSELDQFFGSFVLVTDFDSSSGAQLDIQQGKGGAKGK